MGGLDKHSQLSTGSLQRGAGLSPVGGPQTTLGEIWPGLLMGEA